MSRLYTNTRCIDGKLWRHDPQPDDPYLETEVGTCPECDGEGCDRAQSSAALHRARSLKTGV